MPSQLRFNVLRLLNWDVIDGRCPMNKVILIVLAAVLSLYYAILWVMHVALGLTNQVWVYHEQIALFPLWGLKLAVVFVLFMLVRRLVNVLRKWLMWLLMVFIGLEVVGCLTPYIVAYDDSPLGFFVAPFGIVIKAVNG